MSAATMPDDNRSLMNLRMELGQDVDLLKYIPYSHATFQPQNQLQGPAPDRLLYGDMIEQKDQIWIYFTLLGGGRNYNKETGGNSMISFHTMKGIQNGDAGVRPSKVQDAAQPSALGYCEVLLHQARSRCIPGYADFIGYVESRSHRHWEARISRTLFTKVCPGEKEHCWLMASDWGAKAPSVSESARNLRNTMEPMGIKALSRESGCNRNE